MKAILLAFALLLVCQNVLALEVAGVHVEQTIAVNNQVLKLNGCGIRKKFFVKVYVGSFYAAKHLATPLDVLQDNGDKLIRMNFVHSRVSKEKIIEAFEDGFAANSLIAGSEEVRKFLSFFTADFVKGDTVDLQLGADGTVVVRQNGKTLGTIKSVRLVRGILSIYFGEKPADEGLKEGMLGRES
ncbi:MAG: chalcone isomerase family protein [Dissulfurispiraceae bacterium]